MLTRLATQADSAAIAAIAQAAYEPYIARIGRPPAPMLVDYNRTIRDDEVWVASEADDLVGFIVLRSLEPTALLLDNVAVLPSSQGRGVGRALIELAEHRARSRHCTSVVLYTNEAMVENIAMYEHLGYRETGRAVEDGYARVYFAKHVASD